MTYTPDTLAADRLAHALRVATDPCFAPFPEERALAWAALKEAKGQTHKIWRLARGASPLANTLARINGRGLRRRIIARAEAIARGPETDPPGAA